MRLVEADVSNFLLMNSTINTEEQAGWLTRKAGALIALLFGCVIYLGNTGFPGLLDDADASHAVVAREILQRHDWVILYMNGIRYLMKAPLHYWAVAASYAVLGVNEFRSTCRSRKLPMSFRSASTPTRCVQMRNESARGAS